MEEVATLKLADGITWGIAAGNESASTIVSRLVKVMQLGFRGSPVHQFIVSVEEDWTQWKRLPALDNGVITCAVAPPYNADITAIQMMSIASLIALDTEHRGGVLLHGALAEWDGRGVILAGPGDVGKTTASQRLHAPWRSLCDDTTLVVRDKQGIYWAHPWPTWSRFMFGGTGGSWNVQHAVPLRGIFFLNQAEEDQIEAVNIAQAICLMVESTEQASLYISRRMEEDDLRELRLRRFDSICALAQTVSCYTLRLSLTGAFWREIEAVIMESSRGGA